MVKSHTLGQSFLGKNCVDSLEKIPRKIFPKKVGMQVIGKLKGRKIKKKRKEKF